MASHAIWSLQCTKHIHVSYEQVLKPFIDKCTVVYFDDILFFSTTIESHDEHLKVVFEVLCANKLIPCLLHTFVFN